MLLLQGMFTRDLTSKLTDVCFSVITITSVFIIDSFYYGRPTFTPLSFLQINLSQVSQFYGKQIWHYYIFQALPILCATALPWVIDGFWSSLRTGGTSLFQLASLTCWTVAVYSLISHKEWRFLHPILPILHLFAAKSIVDRRNSRPSLDGWLSMRSLAISMILLQIPISLYLTLVHGRAQIAVSLFLRQLPDSEIKSLGLLMPCHSIPTHSYLHKPHLAIGNRLWSLTCDPPLQ
jgi:GPI mannosyltransferase 3